MDEVNVLRQACCSLRYLFLKLVTIVPFRQAIAISSICNEVFRSMFLKPDSVVIISSGGTEWETARLLKFCNCWLTLVGRGTMYSFLKWKGGSFAWGIKCESRQVRCRGQWSLWVTSVFWHGCRCMSNRHMPFGNTGETLLSQYEETQATLQKIRRWL